MNSNSMEILQQVKSGTLSVGEAARRLEELERGAPEIDNYQPAAEPSETVFTPQPEEPQPELGWWKNGWLIPFWAGTGIFVFSAVWMGWVYSGSQGVGFACSWMLMLFGMLILFLGWWSRQARWAHVRVQEASGSRFAISLPLPLGLSAWILRVLVPFVPQLREKNFEHLPGLLDAMAGVEGSISVEVNEADGQRVRVYII